jgi:hypothetical protein
MLCFVGVIAGFYDVGSLANLKIVCLNPAWSAFVGCSMNRNIKADILAAGEWQNPGEIEESDDPYTCLPRAWGVLIKKA